MKRAYLLIFLSVCSLCSSCWGNSLSHFQPIFCEKNNHQHPNRLSSVQFRGCASAQIALLVHKMSFKDGYLPLNDFEGDFSIPYPLRKTIGSDGVYPVSDLLQPKLPRNLRKFDHPLFANASLNLKGLNELRMSGSAQFSEKTLTLMMNGFSIAPDKIIVIDLREESHGFINGEPVSWTDGNNYANIHKTEIDIIEDEALRLKQALESKKIVIDRIKKPTCLIVESIQTEEELVKEAGARYIRLPVTDHKRPHDRVVDDFIHLIKQISCDDWMHVHCKAGRGRTTTFLTLFDIAKNGRTVSLDDILARQFLIGGVDLTEVNKGDLQRSESANARLEFIRQFYRYCQEVPDFQIGWSQWLSGARLD